MEAGRQGDTSPFWRPQARRGGRRARHCTVSLNKIELMKEFGWEHVT